MQFHKWYLVVWSNRRNEIDWNYCPPQPRLSVSFGTQTYVTIQTYKLYHFHLLCITCLYFERHYFRPQTKFCSANFDFDSHPSFGLLTAKTIPELNLRPAQPVSTAKQQNQYSFRSSMQLFLLNPLSMPPMEAHRRFRKIFKECFLDYSSEPLASLLLRFQLYLKVTLSFLQDYLAGFNHA